MNRRQLLHSSFAFALAKPCCELPALPPAAFQVLESSLVIDLRQAAPLLPAGGAVRLLDEPRKLNLIVARISDGRFHAWSGVCTHGGAPLAYNHRHGTALCSSVGHSEFDARGQVVRGPAPKPISAYPASRSGHVLTVSLEPLP